MNTLLFILIGMTAGFAGNMLGGKYYEKRFERKWEKAKNYIPAVILCGLGGGLFTLYGYSVTTMLCYIVLTSALQVIGRIDKNERIIPNAILLLLLAIRTIAVAAECVMNRETAVYIILSAVMGVVYGSVVFLLARFFCKDAIGMGDIKLLAVIGYYVGSNVILQLIMISLISAMGSSMVKVLKKKLSLKDSVCYAPFITISSILVMFLGV